MMLAGYSAVAVADADAGEVAGDAYYWIETHAA